MNRGNYINVEMIPSLWTCLEDSSNRLLFVHHVERYVHSEVHAEPSFCWSATMLHRDPNT